MCGGLPGIPGEVAVMMAGWRWGAEWTMQKTRVYVCGRGFEFASGGGRRPWRPIDGLCEESFAGTSNATWASRCITLKGKSLPHKF
jgi:hypothetical protein